MVSRWFGSSRFPRRCSNRSRSRGRAGVVREMFCTVLSSRWTYSSAGRTVSAMPWRCSSASGSPLCRSRTVRLAGPTTVPSARRRGVTARLPGRGATSRWPIGDRGDPPIRAQSAPRAGRAGSCPRTCAARDQTSSGPTSQRSRTQQPQHQHEPGKPHRQKQRQKTQARPQPRTRLRPRSCADPTQPQGTLGWRRSRAAADPGTGRRAPTAAACVRPTPAASSMAPSSVRVSRYSARSSRSRSGVNRDALPDRHIHHWGVAESGRASAARASRAVAGRTAPRIATAVGESTGPTARGHVGSNRLGLVGAARRPPR